jgi:O-antigen biosynthesis protein
VLPALLSLALFTLGASALTLFYAAAGAWRAEHSVPEGRGRRSRLVALTALLHLMQPAARLVGRLTNGLAPWRRNPGAGIALPLRRSRSHWHEAWLHPEERVRLVEEAIKHAGGRVVRGGAYDRWDLELQGGVGGAARLLILVEEHGRGRQLVRCRVWPRAVGFLPWLALGLSAIGGVAVAARAWTGAGLAGGVLAIVVATLFAECGHAVAAALHAFEALLVSGPPAAAEEAETPHVPPVAAMALEEA